MMTRLTNIYSSYTLYINVPSCDVKMNTEAPINLLVL